MTNSPENLSLPDRLRLAGFELMLQGCPAWLYSGPYEAARALDTEQSLSATAEHGGAEPVRRGPETR